MMLRHPDHRRGRASRSPTARDCSRGAWKPLFDRRSNGSARRRRRAARKRVPRALPGVTASARSPKPKCALASGGGSARSPTAPICRCQHWSMSISRPAADAAAGAAASAAVPSARLIALIQPQKRANAPIPRGAGCSGWPSRWSLLLAGAARRRSSSPRAPPSTRIAGRSRCCTGSARPMRR